MQNLTEKIYLTLDENSIKKKELGFQLFNFPPSSNKTFSYLKIRYEVKAKEYFGSIEVEGEPIYIHELSNEMVELIKIWDAANKLILTKIKKD